MNVRPARSGLSWIRVSFLAGCQPHIKDVGYVTAEERCRERKETKKNKKKAETMIHSELRAVHFHGLVLEQGATAHPLEEYVSLKDLRAP